MGGGGDGEVRKKNQNQLILQIDQSVKFGKKVYEISKAKGKTKIKFLINDFQTESLNKTLKLKRFLDGSLKCSFT